MYVFLHDVYAVCRFTDGQYLYTVRGKYLEGENIGEFGEFVANRQIITLQNIQFYHPKAWKSEFANILSAKSLRNVYSPIFSPSKYFPRTVCKVVNLSKILK